MYWLPPDEIVFPPATATNPDGILAIGGDLSPERLLLAYSKGIFPWYNPGEVIMWWCPDPRFVLYPADLKVHKSMRSYFNQNKYQVTYNQQFEGVMRACAEARPGQEFGTWISEEMIEGYVALHELGFAHSVEVWDGEALVGGLYGIAIGKVFFGESMFQKKSNASKFGFISLVRRLTELGFELIDCQQETSHLGSLGAVAIDRMEFLGILARNEHCEKVRTVL